MQHELEAMDVERRKNFISGTRSYFYTFLIEKFGIVCMSKTITNEILWGYYNQHKGFAIEYEYGKFPVNFSAPFRINYLDSLKKIDVSKFKHLEAAFFVLNTIKKIDWKQEEEYRFIVTPSAENSFITTGVYNNNLSTRFRKSRVQICSEESIKSITLGFHFFSLENERNFSKKGKAIIKLQENIELKKRLLSHIIEKSITCRTIIFDDETFNFELEELHFEQLDEDRYLVHTTPIKDAD